MEWAASTLHITSEHGVSSTTTADVHTLAACSRLNWCPRQFKWTRLFRRKMKSGFCSCAITFQMQSTSQFMHAAHKRSLRKPKSRTVVMVNAVFTDQPSTNTT